MGDAGFGFGGDGAEKRGAFWRDGEEEGVVFAAVQGELEGIQNGWLIEGVGRRIKGRRLRRAKNVPQRLKPHCSGVDYGTAEAVP